MSFSGDEIAENLEDQAHRLSAAAEMGSDQMMFEVLLHGNRIYNQAYSWSSNGDLKYRDKDKEDGRDVIESFYTEEIRAETDGGEKQEELHMEFAGSDDSGDRVLEAMNQYREALSKAFSETSLDLESRGDAYIPENAGTYLDEF